MMKKLFVYCDGAIEPKNPGGHGVGGFVIKSTDGSVIHTGAYDFGQYPELTNNAVESGAISAALQWLAAHSMTDCELLVRSDSQIIIRQLRREYNCSEKLGQMRDITERLAAMFPKVDYEWIPREENTEADEASRSLYK